MERPVYDRMAAIEDRHWWFLGRRRILERVLRRLVTLPPEPDILEAGCGTGGNLALLGGFGRLHAFEPDAGARDLAALKRAAGRTAFGSGAEILEGSLPDGLPFPPDSFDLVAALDILEHVEDDRASIRSLGGLLHRGGWLVTTVPAFGFLWSRHDELHHHKRRYSKRELLAAIEAAGLTTVHVTYFNSLLFPVVAAIRLARKALGLEGSDDERLPSPRVNAWLEAIFASERHLLGRLALPFGVSLLVVARRPLSDSTAP